MSGIFYGFKMLLRKGGTASAVLSIALLVAIIASMNSIVNYIGFQTQVLSRLVNPGKTYIILSQNSTSITDSLIDAELASRLVEVEVRHAFPQKILTANLKTESGNRTVKVRAVGNVEGFLKLRGAYMNGTEKYP